MINIIIIKIIINKIRIKRKKDEYITMTIKDKDGFPIRLRCAYLIYLA